MNFTHDIIDSGSYFEIDPATRAISSVSDMHNLVQNDHNSERFTFRIPKVVEGHDMMTADRIEIHYTNLSKNRRQQYDNMYVVLDEDKTYDSESDTMSFSWLISGNATRLAGSLKFSIAFVCLDEDGTIAYEWGTQTFDRVTVHLRLDHDRIAQESYPDFYSALKEEVTPVKGVDYFDGAPGNDGPIGPQGDPGNTPIKGVDYFTDQDKEELCTEIESRIEGPDWNANEGEAGYVKNRTHWEEEVAIFPEQALTPIANGVIGAAFAGSFIDGLTYKVTWNGVEYNCVCVNGMLGNASVTGGEDTGEPFLIVTDQGMLGAVPLGGDGSAVVKIVGKSYHKIDSGYMPQNVFYFTLDHTNNKISIDATYEEVNKQFAHNQIVKLVNVQGGRTLMCEERDIDGTLRFWGSGRHPAVLKLSLEWLKDGTMHYSEYADEEIVVRSSTSVGSNSKYFVITCDDNGTLKTEPWENKYFTN